jgi:hypothetical protein
VRSATPPCKTKGELGANLRFAKLYQKYLFQNGREPIMQKNNPTAKIECVANPRRFRKRIGSVIYDVGVHFKKDATETLDKKVLRLIKNELEAVS